MSLLISKSLLFSPPLARLIARPLAVGLGTALGLLPHRTFISPVHITGASVLDAYVSMVVMVVVMYSNEKSKKSFEKNVLSRLSQSFQAPSLKLGIVPRPQNLQNQLNYLLTHPQFSILIGPSDCGKTVSLMQASEGQKAVLYFDTREKKSAISFVNGLAGVLGFTSNADNKFDISTILEVFERALIKYNAAHPSLPTPLMIIDDIQSTAMSGNVLDPSIKAFLECGYGMRLHVHAFPSLDKHRVIQHLVSLNIPFDDAGRMVDLLGTQLGDIFAIAREYKNGGRLEDLLTSRVSDSAYPVRQALLGLSAGPVPRDVFVPVAFALFETLYSLNAHSVYWGKVLQSLLVSGFGAAQNLVASPEALPLVPLEPVEITKSKREEREPNVLKLFDIVRRTDRTVPFRSEDFDSCVAAVRQLVNLQLLRDVDGGTVAFHASRIRAAYASVRREDSVRLSVLSRPMVSQFLKKTTAKSTNKSSSPPPGLSLDASTANSVLGIQIDDDEVKRKPTVSGVVVGGGGGGMVKKTGEHGDEQPGNAEGVLKNNINMNAFSKDLVPASSSPDNNRGEMRHLLMSAFLKDKEDDDVMKMEMMMTDVVDMTNKP